MRQIWVLLLCSVLSLQGCIAVSVDKIDAEPGFDWDTLKRDLILMTPLIDLRSDVQTPKTYEKNVAPFSREQEIEYAEVFKKAFFKKRKDIRVFGAGGAFESISKIANLKDIAKKVLNKEDLSPDEKTSLDDARQDKRFIFFFNFTNERLQFEFSVEQPAEAKGLYVEKNYGARRMMTLQMALWDTQTARTVFISEKTLDPAYTNQYLIRTGRSPSSVKGDRGRYSSSREPDIFDQMGNYSLEQELHHHRGRFPAGFPEREPSFTDSFDDFALSLPIKGSEQNKIEYEYFSNHRPEITLRNSSLGSKSMSNIFVGTSSIIYNRYRLGGGLEFSSSKPKVSHANKSYVIDNLCLCMTADLEWELSDNLRMLTGSVLGAGSFGIKRDAPDTFDNVEPASSNDQDGYWYAAPRLKFIVGPKQGFQFGLGVYNQFYSGLVEPQFTENKPQPWGVELTLAVTFRGF